MFENLMTDSALPEAGRSSVSARMASVFVMGLFGTLIALLARLFPDAGDEAE